MNTYKCTTITEANGDKWDIHYLLIRSDIIKVTVNLYRPNRKFYQSKYYYEDWDLGNIINIRDKAKKLIAKYYEKKEIIDANIKFFND